MTFYKFGLNILISLDLFNKERLKKRGGDNEKGIKGKEKKEKIRKGDHKGGKLVFKKIVCGTHSKITKGKGFQHKFLRRGGEKKYNFGKNILPCNVRMVRRRSAGATTCPPSLLSQPSGPGAMDARFYNRPIATVSIS